jgi:DNA end-binding protein Ku
MPQTSSERFKMAPRPAWKGYLKISLVSLPVQAFVGTGESPTIRFNQLHRPCHSRIRYVKTCPIHGEVSNDEIVSGYEFAKDQYVEIDPSELEKLRPDEERGITVETFVPPDVVDPAYLAGKTYFLLPDGHVSEKPYQLIASALKAENRHAIGRMMITTREHVVRIRPVDGVLTVDLLEYAAQVRSPADFKDELVDTHPTAPETKLTRQLIVSMSQNDLDLSQYADDYTNRVQELIDAKVEGKELVAAAPAEEPHVVNLMDALKRSMARARNGANRPPRRKSASVTKRAPAARPSTARQGVAKKNTVRRRKSG